MPDPRAIILVPLAIIWFLVTYWPIISVVFVVLFVVIGFAVLMRLEALRDDGE
ncbi:hypothetical protein EDF54_2155 [Rathayibacter sp. PhB93]|uniref:hypothetical protein n=1 Tax=unclassified Rathayibacter TaxID=2609250 RepID=UPI000FB245AC|nr:MULTISPECIES: hypothetical protein [unclassified Rathayibacter]ROQ05536.1 hypothetical protein EDF54_2155 [Rathayibacter sp. PhB93]TDQ12393.1 hypothetical protein EDF17_2252 [Rathayibacter sp. PhB1]